MKKIKCLFVNDEMVMGGVSRVLVNLLKMLDKNKYEIDLLVLHPHGEYMELIPEGVNVIKGTEFFDVCDVPVSECRKNGRFLKKLSFALLLKTGLICYSIVKERKKMGLSGYDVEIAFKEGLCSVFVAYGDSKKKINWIHADYLVRNYAAKYMTTMRKVLGLIDENVAVSLKAADSFEKVFGLKGVRTIHNVMDVESITARSREYADFRHSIFTLIAVGRLHPQKSYDRLLETMRILRERGVEAELFILGDGELREELETRRQTLMLDNVHFLGNKENPYSYIRQADALVLSSLYEGLPTVVYEALILHVPVVTMEVAGVREQLNGETGIICANDTAALVDAIEKMIAEHARYRKGVSTYTYENSMIIEEVDKLFASDPE